MSQPNTDDQERNQNGPEVEAPYVAPRPPDYPIELNLARSLAGPGPGELADALERMERIGGGTAAGQQRIGGGAAPEHEAGFMQPQPAAGQQASGGARQSPEVRASGPEDGREPETQEAEWARLLPNVWMLTYVVNLAQHGIPHHAARAARVSSRIVSRYSAVCPALGNAIREAMVMSKENLEAALTLSATIGDLQPVVQRGVVVYWKRVKSVQAAQVLLQALEPERYGRDPEPQGHATGLLSTPAAVGQAVREALIGMAQRAALAAGRLISVPQQPERPADEAASA